MSLKKSSFLEKYEQIYKEGPTVKYQNPDSWMRADPF